MISTALSLKPSSKHSSGTKPRSALPCRGRAADLTAAVAWVLLDDAVSGIPLQPLGFRHTVYCVGTVTVIDRGRRYRRRPWVAEASTLMRLAPLMVYTTVPRQYLL